MPLVSLKPKAFKSIFQKKKTKKTASPQKTDVTTLVQGIVCRPVHKRSMSMIVPKLRKTLVKNSRRNQSLSKQIPRGFVDRSSTQATNKNHVN